MSLFADPPAYEVSPRFIRLRDAPRYLGMDKNRFNREVRPALTNLPMGVQGVAFDRLDLDRWADDYKSRNGPDGHPKSPTCGHFKFLHLTS
jgi:hypothetical protein